MVLKVEKEINKVVVFYVDSLEKEKLIWFIFV